MGTPVVAQIVKSGAAIWYAPTGEAVPDETSVDFGDAWGGNWARVGYTKEPLTVAYESEEADITVEEELAPIRRFRIAEALTLETILSELTAEYLQLVAANQTAVTTTPAAVGQVAFEETGLGGVAVLTEKTWGIEGRYLSAAGVEFPIRMFIHKGTAMLNGPLEFSRKSDDYTGIPLQIKALADPTQDAGERLCLFQRVTAIATPA